VSVCVLCYGQWCLAAVQLICICLDVYNDILLQAPNPICSHSVIMMGNFGIPLGPLVGTFSIFLKVNNPSISLPKTTCLLSKKCAGSQVIKNWHPFVLGPEFA
jgi:hypothetical protein